VQESLFLYFEDFLSRALFEEEVYVKRTRAIIIQSALISLSEEHQGNLFFLLQASKP